MSTINHVPFDINRTAVERNATVKRRGTVPVFNSAAIHPTKSHEDSNDRRRNHRRKLLGGFNKNNRLLTERRQILTDKPSSEKEQQLDNVHIQGSIIDLEV